MHQRARRSKMANGDPRPRREIRTRDHRSAGNRAIAQSVTQGAPTSVQRDDLDEDERTALDEAIAQTALTPGEQVQLRAMAHAAKNSRVYQATPRKNVRSILAQGLDPSKGGRGASKKSRDLVEQSRNKIHFTTEKVTAEAYQGYFQGKETFLGEPSPKPTPAEILKVSMPAELAATREKDTDSVGATGSFTTTSAIPSELVRSTAPASRRAKGLAESHQRKGESEIRALLTHWPNGVMRPDPDDPQEMTMLHMLRKVLQSVVVPGDGKYIPDRTLMD